MSVVSGPLTVAELISVLSKLPQGAFVYIECDEFNHQCEGAWLDDDKVYLEAG